MTCTFGQLMQISIILILNYMTYLSLSGKFNNSSLVMCLAWSLLQAVGLAK